MRVNPLWMGLVLLKRDPTKLTSPLYTTWRYKEKFTTWKRALCDHAVPNPRLPASRTVRLYFTHVWNFCYRNPKWSRHSLSEIILGIEKRKASCLLTVAKSRSTLVTLKNYEPHLGSLFMDFPGKNTGIGCHFLLQGSSTQGLNLISWIGRQILSCWAARDALYLGLQGNLLRVSVSEWSRDSRSYP